MGLWRSLRAYDCMSSASSDGGGRCNVRYRSSDTGTVVDAVDAVTDAGDAGATVETCVSLLAA